MPNPDLNDDQSVISPPRVVAPLYGCAEVVRVRGFIRGADLTVVIDGNAVATAVGLGDEAEGQRVPVPALSPGQIITAYQEWKGAKSDPSVAVVAQDHSKEYPNGLPASNIAPKPVFECGRAVASRGHVPGSVIQAFSQSAPGAGNHTSIGKRQSSVDWTQVWVAPHQFTKGEALTVQYAMCQDASPMSAEEEVVAAPATLPSPVVGDLYAGQMQLSLTGLVHGGSTEIFVQGAPVASGTTAYDNAVADLPAPLNGGELVEAFQTLCSAGPKTSVTVHPCGALPAPRIAPPAVGNTWVSVTEAVQGARILVFDAARIEIGDGGGTRVELYRPSLPGDRLTVIQQLDGCTSQTAWQVDATCNRIPELSDPSRSGPYAAGRMDYEMPNLVSFGGVDSRIMATIRFPAAAGAPDGLIPGSERFPLVVFLHGHHGTRRHYLNGDRARPYELCGTSGEEAPNWRGYDFALDALARNGYIAVSINANDLHCRPDFIPERAELILHHLAQWKQFDDASASDPVFKGMFNGRVDLGRIGLVGHSRGGEAVVKAAEDNNDPALRIGAVLSVAPTDNHGYVLNDTPLLVLLPAADGDVANNEGARIYDRAFKTTTGTKSQFYIYGADHNQFNREWHQFGNSIWADSDGPWHGMPDMIARQAQEDMLRVWTRMFFDLHLQGFGAYAPVFRGDAAVSGLLNERVFVSYETPDSYLFDDHEDGNPLLNLLRGQVIPDSFSTFLDLPFTYPAGHNSSFFHETQGLLASWMEPNAAFSSELKNVNVDLNRYEYLSFRVTQVNDTLNHKQVPIELLVSLEDANGPSIRLSTEEGGVIPYPYLSTLYVPKSMMRTIRLPLSCFVDQSGKELDRTKLESIVIETAGSQGMIGLDQFAFSN